MAKRTYQPREVCIRQAPCPICSIASFPSPEERMRAEVAAMRADIERTEARIAEYEAAIRIWERYRREQAGGGE